MSIAEGQSFSSCTHQDKCKKAKFQREQQFVLHEKRGLIGYHVAMEVITEHLENECSGTEKGKALSIAEGQSFSSCTHQDKCKKAKFQRAQL